MFSLSLQFRHAPAVRGNCGALRSKRLPAAIAVACALLATAQEVGAGDFYCVPGCGPARDADGFIEHLVQSPFQAGTTRYRVLPPDRLVSGRKYPVVYVLPVEARDERRYGDGLIEVRRHDLHNEHQAFFVAPSFSQLPWFADHPTDPEIRQESYLLRTILPFVERNYPVERSREGRLLLGFSKSGWGAWTLLLRNPDVFGRAAGWDAPFQMEWPSKYGSADIFRTSENFEKYRIAPLLRARATELQGAPRLYHAGYGNFRTHHNQTRDLLADLQVPSEYRDGPLRKHDWHSGWVSDAVVWLLSRQDKVRLKNVADP